MWGVREREREAGFGDSDVRNSVDSGTLYSEKNDEETGCQEFCYQFVKLVMPFNHLREDVSRRQNSHERLGCRLIARIWDRAAQAGLVAPGGQGTRSLRSRLNPSFHLPSSSLSYPPRQVYTRYGKCYTFNADPKSSLPSRVGGMGSGLEIMLDIQQEEYLPIWRETSMQAGKADLGTLAWAVCLGWFSKGPCLHCADETSFEAGIRVQIHSQEEPPYIHQLGFGVSPGFQTFVSCQEQRVNTSSWPMGWAQGWTFGLRGDVDQTGPPKLIARQPTHGLCWGYGCWRTEWGSWA